MKIIKEGQYIVRPESAKKCGNFYSAYKKDKNIHILVTAEPSSNSAFSYRFLNNKGEKVGSCSGCLSESDLLQFNEIEAKNVKYLLSDGGVINEFENMAQVKKHIKNILDAGENVEGRMKVYELKSAKEVRINKQIIIK